jgi:hypothetical protein
MDTFCQKLSGIYPSIRKKILYEIGNPDSTLFADYSAGVGPAVC